MLYSTKKPISARNIYKKYSKELDLATAYRVLKIFEKKDIIYSENTEGGKKYYIAKKPHHHITCKKCKKVECVPCRHNFSEVKNFLLIRHELSLTGVCAKCY